VPSTEWGSASDSMSHCSAPSCSQTSAHRCVLLLLFARVQLVVRVNDVRGIVRLHQMKNVFDPKSIMNPYKGVTTSS